MIRPVIPGATRQTQQDRALPVSRRPLPLPTIPTWPARRTQNTVYRTAVIDNRGRITYREILEILGWTTASSLRAFLQLGRLIVRTDPAGTNLITPQGRLCLPLDLRRAVLLRPGDHALLAADRAEDELVVVPEALLDRLLAGGDL